jgi:hypothetical protein
VGWATGLKTLMVIEWVGHGRVFQGGRRFLPMGIGPQHELDDVFKKKARLHQSLYREKALGVPFKDYGSRLTDEDAKKGLNYYQGLGVMKELRKRYPRYNSCRDANLFRSEHIPFNLIAPLKKDIDFAKRVFNVFLDGLVHHVENIGMEWAPKPARDYLDDSTSFDAFVLFTQIDESKTGLGIEIKYTEGPTAPGDKEIRAINDSNSPYWVVTRKSNIYSKGVESKLKADGYR